MRKIGIFILLMTVFTALSLSQAEAGSSGSSGPIFLNKIKSVFTREKKPQQVAPLNTRTTATKRSAKKNSTASNGRSLADIKRAEWKARQQRLGALIDKNNQEVRAKLAQNYQQAQLYQVQLQAQQRAGGQVPVRSTTNSTTTPTTTRRPTRIIIPQKEESGGTKPIFKNYR